MSLTCGKHLNDGIISLRGDIWAHVSVLLFWCVEFPVRVRVRVRVRFRVRVRVSMEKIT